MDSIYLTKKGILFFSGYSLGIAFVKLYEKKDFNEILIKEKKDNFGKFIEIKIENKNKENQIISKSSLFTKELDIRGIKNQFEKYDLKIKIVK